MNNEDQIVAVEGSILNTLEYFGLFNYPLTSNEIHRFLAVKTDLKTVELVLKESSEKIYVFESKYYCLKNNPDWVNERKSGNKRAEELLYKSHKYVKKISSCPFVRSVAISGSLSKYYASEDADIDYFIITKANRLWIARTLLHFYKKFTFLRGNEHFYCMNYFIDEETLEIDQKNVYSAIETVTLLPSYNSEIIKKLKQENKLWVKEYLPNETFNEDNRFVLPARSQTRKSIIEYVINLFFPEKLNRFLMKMTDRKWRRKWKKKKYPMENYDQAFYTTEHISKNHPANYQSQILTALENNGELESQPSCKV